MDHLDTGIGRLKRAELKDVKEQAIALWVASFVEDSPSFAKAYFEDYIRFVVPHFFVNDQGRLVLMAFNTNEGYLNQKATLIEGIAVEKSFQGKGVMTAFMDQWIKWLEREYAYVFIQAYNWQIYARYDFRPFNSNNLWRYTPDSGKFSYGLSTLTIGYVNSPFTDVLRSPLHKSSYFRCMAVSGSEIYSYETASLVLNGDYALNVTYEDERHLHHLLHSLNKAVSFLLPEDLVLTIPGFEKTEAGRMETKLYKRNLSGRFNYVY